MANTSTGARRQKGVGWASGDFVGMSVGSQWDVEGASVGVRGTLVVPERRRGGVWEKSKGYQRGFRWVLEEILKGFKEMGGSEERTLKGAQTHEDGGSLEKSLRKEDVETGKDNWNNTF